MEIPQQGVFRNMQPALKDKNQAHEGHQPVTTQLPLSHRTSSQISFSEMFRCTRSPLVLEAMFPLIASRGMLLNWKGWLDAAEPQLKKSGEAYSIPEEPSGVTGPQAAGILLSVPSTLVPDGRCFFFHGLEKPSCDSSHQLPLMLLSKPGLKIHWCD